MSTNRLMLDATSRRKSPSTFSVSTTSRIRCSSSVVKSLTRVSGLTLVCARIFFDVGTPMPKMYVRPTGEGRGRRPDRGRRSRRVRLEQRRLAQRHRLRRGARPNRRRPDHALRFARHRAVGHRRRVVRVRRVRDARPRDASAVSELVLNLDCDRWGNQGNSLRIQERYGCRYRV